MRSTVQNCLTVILLLGSVSHAAEEPDVASIQQFIHHRFDARNDCVVIGLVDARGSTVIAAGSPDNDTGRPVDGDSLFFIGSASKTFTALLLQDMVARGQMKLDDPVSQYLPKSVNPLARGDKPVTLLHLATQTSGFPFNPSNMTGKDGKEEYETYTRDKMYDFVSTYTLPRDPGSAFGYSNLGMALLGDAIARRAGLDLETVLIDHICRPLGMNSTCVVPTGELKTRLAMGHDSKGKPSLPWQLQAYAPAGSVHSTANDLLKYVSAHVGLTTCPLSPLMEQSHVVLHEDSAGVPDLPGFGTFGRTAMPWVDRGAWQAPDMDFRAHAGGSGSYHAWVGFDLKQRRGVVVLSTANDWSVEAVGFTLLQRRPLTERSVTLFARMQLGLGIALDSNSHAGAIQITKVLDNSPAAKAGVTAGLVIQRIGDVPLDGKSVVEATKLLRGSAGTKVDLELRDPAGKSSVVTVTRQKYLIVPDA